MKVIKILLYPIKSLDPVEVEEAEFTERGSLKYDRVFYIEDSEGNVVNGKREKRIHKIRCRTDLEKEEFEIEIEGRRRVFRFEELENLSEVLSEFLGYKVSVKKDVYGFPDDRKAYGPTIVSDKTIYEVAKWFNLSFEETLLRFRPNILISADEPFEEEKLLGKEFLLGDVSFKGENVSKRCPVPTRNPYTGEEYKNFVKIFIEKRKETLPSWLNPDSFKGNFYRLCLNTNISKYTGGKIKIGDSISLKE